MPVHPDDVVTLNRMARQILDELDAGPEYALSPFQREWLRGLGHSPDDWTRGIDDEQCRQMREQMNKARRVLGISAVVIPFPTRRTS